MIEKARQKNRYADLDADHDDELVWNYKEFNDNDRQYLDIELNASGTGLI
jgi:hypothetical protein